MAAYHVNLLNPHERETIITDAVNAHNEKHTLYEYQNKRSDLPVVRLNVELPIYRMTNFRTCTAQLKYIHEQKVAEDYFRAGQENDSAQNAQHRILVDFAKKGREGSVVPIMSHLSEEKQREPILITSRGVVVNGNRRLAAMRELFQDDPAKFRHFGHIDCAVLPHNVTPDDIREIEVRLQMRAETKLPYGWIEESIAIREMLHAGKKIEYVAELMKKKPKEVTTAARALNEVDIYLKDWEKKPNNYDLVDDAEQIFNDLAKAVNGIEGELLETKRRIAWLLISADPGQLDGRVYSYKFSFQNKTKEVISALCDRMSIDLATSSSGEDSDDLEMDIELDDETSVDTPMGGLIVALDNSNPAQRDSITEDLVEICNSIRESERQVSVGKQALKAINTANSKLMSADLTKADPETYDAIRAQLGEIRNRVENLENALCKYTADSSESSKTH